MSLSDTSALVLLWAQGAAHTSKNARMYLESLNLDSGAELFKKCNAVWNHYDEVIKNRKKCILDMSRHVLKDGKIKQMIILGAGFDALSIEILHHVNELCVYDIDVANMHLKERLLKNTLGQESGIQCIDADVKNPDKLLYTLEKCGWNSKKPALLVMEGISYYLTKSELSKMINGFSNDKNNRILLEYLLPHECISKEISHIPEKIFSIIKDNHHTTLTRYDESEIGRLLGPGCHITKTLGLKDMEMTRLGQNTYFKKKSHGWIQISQITI